ncbi:MAG: patatin-like phospholipase family protein [archaeon]
MKSPLFKKEIALVLSGGGARGLAHIGVLEVFEKEKIPIDMIIGTSMGALVGGAYLSGNLRELKKKFLSLNKRDVFKMFIEKPSMEGLSRGNSITSMISKFTDNKKIEDLSMPFIAVSADLETGKTVIIGKGSLVDAIRSSISIPGIFVPIHNKGMILVDGGIVDPVPVDIASKYAKKIIVIDVLARMEHIKTEKGIVHQNILDIIEDSIVIMQRNMAKLSMRRKRKREFIIKPKIPRTGSLEFYKAKELIEAGRKEAEKMIPKLKKFLSS